MSSSHMIIRTLDNGAYAFNVIIKNDIICAINNKTKKEVFRTKYIKYLLGSEKTSILINIKPKEYVFIGENIIKFNTKSDIITFSAKIGNSDVVYPYVIDDEYVYILWGDYDHFNKNKLKDIKKNNDINSVYINLTKSNNSKRCWKTSKELKKIGVYPFRKKTIHKRLF